MVVFLGPSEHHTASEEVEGGDVSMSKETLLVNVHTYVSFCALTFLGKNLNADPTTNRNKKSSYFFRVKCLSTLQ